ncbi:MAG: hypothetical protein IPL61_09580 [Myxococcales bacterium]|nr:hypothetical protein [Myxococcales bacterium]
MRDSRVVVLRDAWSGLGPSTITSYELRHDSTGALVGDAQRFVEGEPEVVRTITLAPATAAEFLGLLAAALLSPAPYAAHIEHTDDFPDIRLLVYVGPEARTSGFAMLSTASQGPHHAPWAVTVGGQAFSCEGSHLGRAVAMLRKLCP